MIDIELEAMMDPPLPSDYLSKRVNQMVKLNSEEDPSLANTLQTMKVDQEFVNQNFVQKAKQYDFIPLSYNAQLMAN